MLVRYAFAAFVGVLGACDFTGPDPSPDAPASSVTVLFEATNPMTNADEQSGAVALRVVLSEPVTSDVVVTFGLGGTAMPAVDFVVSSNTVTIPAGQTEQDITFTITSDLDETEASETIEVTLLSASAGVGIGERAIHTVTIADRILPRVRFAQVSTMHTEGGGQTVLQLTLTLPAQGATTVDVAVLPSSTATPAMDATLLAVTPVMFDDGATTAMLPIGEINDALDEEDTEQFNLALRNPSANLIIEGSGITATHTIADNDDLPSVGFTVATNPQPEAGGVVAVDVQLSAVSGRNVTVNYTLGAGTAQVPGDATVNPAPGTLTILAGTMGATIQVTITDDALDEPNETIALALDTPGNATLGIAAQSFVIQDNDEPPTVSFEATSVEVTEAAVVVNANVVLSAVSGRQINVQFTVGGSASNPGDYTVTASPLQIPPNTLAVPIAITVVNDNTDEPNETVVLTLTNANNASLVAPTGFTLTIADDNDAPSTVQFDPTEIDRIGNNGVLEGDSGTQTFSYRVVLDKPSGFEVRVPIVFSGDATDPGDYTTTSANPLVFAPGQTVATITIVVNGDLINGGPPGNFDAGAEDRITMTIDAGNIVNGSLEPDGVERREHDIRDDDPG
jgi:hypothetical protein